MTGHPTVTPEAFALIADDVRALLDETGHHMHLRPEAERSCPVCTARNRLVPIFDRGESM